MHKLRAATGLIERKPQAHNYTERITDASVILQIQDATTIPYYRTTPLTETRLIVFYNTADNGVRHFEIRANVPYTRARDPSPRIVFARRRDRRRRN